MEEKIGDCNFKTQTVRSGDLCGLNGCGCGECKGEENCILFQIYKQLEWRSE